MTKDQYLCAIRENNLSKIKCHHCNNIMDLEYITMHNIQENCSSECRKTTASSSPNHLSVAKTFSINSRNYSLCISFQTLSRTIRSMIYLYSGHLWEFDIIYKSNNINYLRFQDEDLMDQIETILTFL